MNCTMLTGKARGPSIGLTLIELLVTVAIIGVLAALLMPSMAMVRSGARQMACASQLRQLGMVFTAYASDFDDRIPFATSWDPPPNQNIGRSWDYRIRMHFQDMQSHQMQGSGTTSRHLLLIRCAADPTLKAASGTGSYGSRSYSMPEARVSGRSVSVGVHENSSQPHIRPPTMSQIVSPSETIMLAEYPAPGNGHTVGATVRYPEWQVRYTGGRGLHNGRVNYLFVDGHVESRDPATTVGTGHLFEAAGRPWAWR